MPPARRHRVPVGRDRHRVDRSTGLRTGTGEPLRHSYLRQAVAAIGYRHELEGLASPLRDSMVPAVLRGYGRIHGTDVRGKDPVRLEELTRIATTLPRPSPHATRDRALVLLATHPDYGLGAGQLARLDGEHILFPPDPSDPTVLLVHPGGRSLGLDPIDIPPDDQVPGACAARALVDLAPDAFGPVFRSASKQRLSRQAVLKIIPAAIAGASLARRATSGGVSRLPDSTDRARLAQHITSPDPAAVRDLALILNLYWGTFRGSELTSMTWADAHIVEQGVEWNVRRAKNDQLGRGEVVGAARNPNPLLCPAAALSTWHASLTGLHGRPSRRDEPRLHPPRPPPGPTHRHHPRRRLPDRQTSRPRRRPGRRLRQPLTPSRVRLRRPRLRRHPRTSPTHGRWADITSIDPYYRKTQTWGQNNPSQRLARAGEP